MTLDLQFVRSQFPAFSEPSLQGWAFFENAGGSYPCKQVVERLNTFYTKHKVQPYYPYPAAQEAGRMMDESYERMAAYLNVSPEEIHFGPSTTQNIYVLANAMRPMWKEGDQIIVSCQDHEANAGAWRKLSERGIKVVEWHVDQETGLLDIEVLEGMITERTRMVAYPHCSNVIGQLNPVEQISRIARERNVLTVVDGVGWAPHGLPDLKGLDADIYLFSLYKTFGPHQGLMYVNKDLIGRMQNQAHFFKEGVTRNMLVPAGPDHAQVAAAAGVIDYMDAVYEHHFNDEEPPATRNRKLNTLFREHEGRLLQPLLEFLEKRDDVRILGTTETKNRAPIVAFLPLEKSVDEVYQKLTAHKLMLGKGHFYAVRPLREMNIDTDPGVIRISFVHYTSPEEIEQLLQGLEDAL